MVEQSSSSSDAVFYYDEAVEPKIARNSAELAFMMRRSYSDLPEGITDDILCRLPAKSVGRCRCVSKSWLEHTSRPEFIKTHLKLARISRQELLIFQGKVRKCRDLYYSHLRNAHQLFDKITLSTPACLTPFGYWSSDVISGSVDGLVLLGDLWRKFVLNPLTREAREVPFRLDFLQTPYNTVFGFGYDSVKDDYKILTIAFHLPEVVNDQNMIEPESTETFVNVYSMKTNSWRSVGSFPYGYCNVNERLTPYGKGLFAHGCIHFLAEKNTEDCIDYTIVIVAFDVAEEKFHKVSPPSCFNSNRFKVENLAQLGGCLCFTVHDSHVWELWMMKEYGVVESWTKFSINDPRWISRIPVCLFEQNDLVVWDDHRKQLAMIDLKQGTVNKIVVGDIFNRWAEVVLSCVESLVSPGLCIPNSEIEYYSWDASFNLIKGKHYLGATSAPLMELLRTGRREHR